MNISKQAPKIIEKIGLFINPVLLNFNSERNKILIFYFHGVYKTLKEKDLNHVDPQNNISINEFVDFINYFLEHNYTFIGPDNILSGLEENKRYAMITFDDGYYNNYLAIEVLNQFKIPGIFFITSKNLTENKSYWWDIIFKYRIKKSNNLKVIGREQELLKAYKYTYIDNYIVKNFGLNAFSPWSDIDRPFNIAEIKEISQNPCVIIGNHTHNHAILYNYSRAEIREEFQVCNKILFNNTGILPYTVSFPNGGYNNLVLEEAKKAGFRFGFTALPDRNVVPTKIVDFNILSRFITHSKNIKSYGSFYRMGYLPEGLYYNLAVNLSKFKKKLFNKSK